MDFVSKFFKKKKIISATSTNVAELVEKYSDFSTIEETLYLKRAFDHSVMCFPGYDREMQEIDSNIRSLSISELICWRVGIEAARIGIVQTHYYDDDSRLYCHPGDEKKFEELPYPHMAIHGVTAFKSD